jgi:DNA-binding transcriptional ArsR family regulator
MVVQPNGYGSGSGANLDAVFAALADPTRRAILSRLIRGDASVGELAAPFDMSQPAVSKHLQVLQRAGLVERSISGARRPARVRLEGLSAANTWLEEYRAQWETRFAQLDVLLRDMTRPRRTKQDGSNKRTSRATRATRATKRVPK